MAPAFPHPVPSFLWGAATSAHQVEGDNHRNDWWEWEQAGKVAEPSGVACDHFRRFREDIALTASLGHNAHRFSLEWSRLEPESGAWDESAARHYLEVFQELRARNIEPVVTLHHFTHPQWFAREGGWLGPRAVEYFSRYVLRAVKAFGPFVRFWITINEPLLYAYHAYLIGVWPPGIRDFVSTLRVFRTLILAHVEAYRVIHDGYRHGGGGPVWVSVAKHMIHFEPCRSRSLADRSAVYLRNWFFNDLWFNALTSGFLFFPGIFCESLPRRKTLDYLGINYYFRSYIRHAGFGGTQGLGASCDSAHHQGQIREVNMMGWDVCPEGLYRLLMRLKRYRLPVMITENGICTLEDSQRERFVREHLGAVQKAMAGGCPVAGYFYWSLLDNFEWAHGFGPRFGLVEVDYGSQKRKVRASAYVLSDCCRKLSSKE